MAACVSCACAGVAVKPVPIAHTAVAVAVAGKARAIGSVKNGESERGEVRAQGKRAGTLERDGERGGGAGRGPSRRTGLVGNDDGSKLRLSDVLQARGQLRGDHLRGARQRAAGGSAAVGTRYDRLAGGARKAFCRVFIFPFIRSLTHVPGGGGRERVRGGRREARRNAPPRAAESIARSRALSVVPSSRCSLSSPTHRMHLRPELST